MLSIILSSRRQEETFRTLAAPIGWLVRASAAADFLGWDRLTLLLLLLLLQFLYVASYSVSCVWSSEEKEIEEN